LEDRRLKRSLVVVLVTCWTAGAAIVPDGAVVHSEADAPVLTAEPPAKQPMRPQHTPRPPSSSKPAAKRPAAGSAAKGSSPSASLPTKKHAFDQGGEQGAPDPGGSRPLQPLAPAPLASGSTAPLWTALFLFLLLAVAGFWLAQQRSDD
jgi:hypothetical protein